MNELSRNLGEHWQCQTCFQHFPNDNELRQHNEAFQSRLQQLLSRVQHLFTEIRECSSHSGPKLSDDEHCGASPDDDADNLVNDDGDGYEEFLCPHEECEGKLRTSFKDWKSFVTHYTAHVHCRETCGFCALEIHRVRKYVTHFDNCRARKDGERTPELLSKESNAIGRRRILRESASKELKLKRSILSNTSKEAVSSQKTNSRKRTREMADADENLRQTQKRRIAEEDVIDAAVATISDLPYQASSSDDVARETATPARFGMPSNGALIPIHHAASASLPLHCDMNESTALSDNDGPFSAERTDLLQYSLGSDETFMADEYISVFTRAPLLFSHTMDGSSSYPRQEYEATTHVRAPLLRSHTMDGSSSVSADHQYARAPLLASHTMDGSSSYQTVCHYEAPAQPSVEYDTADRHHSDTQIANEEMTALYGIPQAIQNLVPGASGYG